MAHPRPQDRCGSAYPARALVRERSEPQPGTYIFTRFKVDNDATMQLVENMGSLRKFGL
jgi:hypothetical protein